MGNFTLAYPNRGIPALLGRAFDQLSGRMVEHLSVDFLRSVVFVVGAISQPNEDSLVLVLHQALDCDGEIIGADDILVVGLLRAQDATAVSEKLGDDLRAGHTEVFGLNMVQPSLMSHIRIVTD